MTDFSQFDESGALLRVVQLEAFCQYSAYFLVGFLTDPTTMLVIALLCIDAISVIFDIHIV